MFPFLILVVLFLVVIFVAVFVTVVGAAGDPPKNSRLEAREPHVPHVPEAKFIGVVIQNHCLSRRF